MLKVIGLGFRIVFWSTAVLVMLPVLLVLRVDQRVAGIDPHISFGYDDDDPGVDIDEE